MPAPLSTHLPQVSGGTTAAFTGTLVVDTGLRDLQSFACSLAQDAVANASSVSYALVSQVAGTTRKVTIKAWKADGATAASVSAIASWLAIGK
jgi:hypothetical protein